MKQAKQFIKYSERYAHGIRVTEMLTSFEDQLTRSLGISMAIAKYAFLCLLGIVGIKIVTLKKLS